MSVNDLTDQQLIVIRKLDNIMRSTQSILRLEVAKDGEWWPGKEILKDQIDELERFRKSEYSYIIEIVK